MTASCTMTPKQTKTSSKRDASSFSIFSNEKFISGYQSLVTLQPLNKTKRRGWFIRNDDLNTCKWNAVPGDFESGTALFDYQQEFGMKPNLKVEKGINFVNPRVQFLLRSPLMIEQATEMRRIVGKFDDPDVRAMFDADKAAQELANSKNEMYKRKYVVRTKYLVFIVTKENERAHELPIVLTMKGLNGTDLAEKVRLFEKEMGKCLNKATMQELPLTYNEKFNGTTIFDCELVSDMRGTNNVEICAVESFEAPDYSTIDKALESLHSLSIPDKDREDTWKVQKLWKNFINQHSAEDAKKLGGNYGMKEGIQILPVGHTIETKALPSRDETTGEDQAF